MVVSIPFPLFFLCVVMVPVSVQVLMGISVVGDGADGGSRAVVGSAEALALS